VLQHEESSVDGVVGIGGGRPLGAVTFGGVAGSQATNDFGDAIEMGDGRAEFVGGLVIPGVPGPGRPL